MVRLGPGADAMKSISCSLRSDHFGCEYFSYLNG